MAHARARSLAIAASLVVFAAHDARVDETWPDVDVSTRRAPGWATLETRDVNGWQHTPCVPPCKLRLDPSAEYRISGTGVVDSEPFALPRGVDRVHLDVKPGSTLVRDIGTIFSVGGLLFAAAGGTILVLPQSENASHEERVNKTVVGLAFLTNGAIAAAIGVGLRLLSDTSVRTAVNGEP